MKYLKDTEVNINNVLIITGDFNIRDVSWDLNYSFHSIYKNTFFNIADTFHLDLSIPANYIPTRYLDNQQNSDLVIDLMFLRLHLSEHNNYSIYLEWCLTSNHAPLSVDIVIFKENI